MQFLNIWWVLGITALAWHYVLFCGFVSDDHAVIEGRRDIIPDHEKQRLAGKKESYWVKVFNDGIVMYYLNEVMWKLFKNTPFFWHLLSFSIHIINTFLLYKVAGMFMPDSAALCASLIWAVNPMQNQISGWCSGRPYGISAMFALAILIMWQYPVLTTPLYILGVITSISVGFLPILLKLAHPNSWQGNFYLALLIPAFVFILWKFTRRFAPGALVIDRKHFHFRLKRFNMIVRVYMYYLACLFFPTKMGWYHDVGFSYNEKWEGFNIWALIGYGVVGFIMTQGFFGWWFLLGILPQVNIMVTNCFVQDRYIYFGSMGLALLLAPFLVQYPVLFIAAAAIFASKSHNYSHQLIDDEYMYKENYRNNRKADYALNNLSFFLIQQKRYDEARSYCQRALEINKENKLVWYNLGVTHAAIGNVTSEEGIRRFLKAIDCWKQALQIEPRWKKPAEDIQKVIKILVDSKILTTDKNLGMPGMPAIHTPIMNLGELNASDK